MRGEREREKRERAEGGGGERTSTQQMDGSTRSTTQCHFYFIEAFVLFDFLPLLSLGQIYGEYEERREDGGER